VEEALLNLLLMLCLRRSVGEWREGAVEFATNAVVA
jgi:hypothetical protein